jgi:hypothetical protein
MGRIAILGPFVLLVACVTGCRQPGTISIGPDGLRTFATDPSLICNLSAFADPFAGALTGDASDPERLWLVGAAPYNPRISVVWPQGFHVRFEPNAVLYNEKDVTVARQGETVSLPQVDTSKHAGTYADPYLAYGIVFNRCYPL